MKVDEVSQPTKRAKTANSNRKKARTRNEDENVYMRRPVFEEIYALQRAHKMAESTDKNAVGWGTMMNAHPVTGQFMGHPQAQANNARMHLKTAGNTTRKRTRYVQEDLKLEIPVMVSRECGDVSCNDSVSQNNFNKIPLTISNSNQNTLPSRHHRQMLSFEGPSQTLFTPTSLQQGMLFTKDAL